MEWYGTFWRLRTHGSMVVVRAPATGCWIPVSGCAEKEGKKDDVEGGRVRPSGFIKIRGRDGAVHAPSNIKYLVDGPVRGSVQYHHLRRRGRPCPVWLYASTDGPVWDPSNLMTFVDGPVRGPSKYSVFADGAVSAPSELFLHGRTRPGSV